MPNWLPSLQSLITFTPFFSPVCGKSFYLTPPILDKSSLILFFLYCLASGTAVHWRYLLFAARTAVHWRYLLFGSTNCCTCMTLSTVYSTNCCTLTLSTVCSMDCCTFTTLSTVWQHELLYIYDIVYCLQHKLLYIDLFYCMAARTAVHWLVLLSSSTNRCTCTTLSTVYSTDCCTLTCSTVWQHELLDVHFFYRLATRFAMHRGVLQSGNTICYTTKFSAVWQHDFGVLGSSRNSSSWRSSIVWQHDLLYIEEFYRLAALLITLLLPTLDYSDIVFLYLLAPRSAARRGSPLFGNPSCLPASPLFSSHAPIRQYSLIWPIFLYPLTPLTAVHRGAAPFRKP